MHTQHSNQKRDLFRERSGAELHINLSAIIENYLFLQKKVESARCSAVVKADAYGLGADRISKALAKAGCKNFFVAYLDEGIALRKILKKEFSIYVLHGLIGKHEKLFLDYNLIPILNTSEQIKQWYQFCLQNNVFYEAGIQLDSGMSRFGLDEKEIKDIPLAVWDAFKPKLIVSHLACADTPEHKENTQQLEQFKKLKNFLPNAPSSLAASSGIFLGKAWHFDMVRPGAALYGINPTPREKNPMRSVVTLLGKIIQIKTIHPKTFVGYGASYKAKQTTKIAIISVGYADGFFRSLSEKLYLVHEKFMHKPLPIIGRISMDSLFVDISSLPKDATKIGDKIELVGSFNTLDSIAHAANTIGYEILTSMGNRYYRIYK